MKVVEQQMLPLRRDYYDVGNHLWKRELIGAPTTIDGVPTLLHFRMEDLQEGTSSDLRVSDVNYDVSLPDALFDPDHLLRAAQHPTWARAAARAK